MDKTAAINRSATSPRTRTWYGAIWAGVKVRVRRPRVIQFSPRLLFSDPTPTVGIGQTPQVGGPSQCLEWQKLDN
jgi:hypothetical protein